MVISIRAQLNGLEAEIKRLIDGQGSDQGGIIAPPITITDYRRSAGVDKLRVSVEKSPNANKYWRLIDMWTTNFGSWEVGSDPYSIPGWARNDYMSNFPLAGGDHNIYAMLLDANRAPQPNRQVKFWHDHGAFLKVTNDKGFCEQDIYGSFNPDDPAQRGAWSVQPSGAADRAVGFGLPMNHHVSLFAVWQWVD